MFVYDSQVNLSIIQLPMLLTMFNSFSRWFRFNASVDPYNMLNSLAVKADSLEQNAQITGSLLDYYASSGNRNDDLAEITASLECLWTTSQCLICALQNRYYQPDEVHLVDSINRSIGDCEDNFTRLRDMNRLSLIRLGSSYLFHPRTIQNLNIYVNDLRLRLTHILDTVRPEEPWQMVFHHDDADFSGPEVLQEHASIADLCSKIDVLVPDAAVHHCSVYAKRNMGTGLWFLELPSFMKWLSRENSFLWLNGVAGCGKTFLCSMAIQATFSQHVQVSNTGIGFFYFSFDDQSRQGQFAMVMSLLLQLAKQQGEDGQRAIVNLYEIYSAGGPPMERLLDCLQKVIKRFQNVFIFLDAIDENSPGSKRGEVLTTLGKIRDWALPGLHVLVTSRDEPDIRASLHLTQDDEAVLKKSKEIDLDISNYIFSQLATNPKLRRWEGYEACIQEALIDGAQGV